MTQKTDPAARFWNMIARRYAAQKVADPAAYQYKLDRTAALLRPDMQVLEFGCGTGTTSLTHAPRVARIDAIDFSSGMIAIAREKAAAQGVDNVTFSVAAIQDWQAPDASYDVVMAHSILHLIGDLGATLARVRRLLKPGGLFISSTTCIGDMGWFVRTWLPPVGRLGVIPKVYPLSGEGLQAQIRQAGYSIQESWRPAQGKALFLIAAKT